jgi:predicted RNA binding protein YcfA (HicA-like mRNA interferase family)
MPKTAPETNRKKVAAQLKREGWTVRHGGSHDVYTHPNKPGIIALPRHRTLSIGVARSVAQAAGWI